MVHFQRSHSISSLGRVQAGGRPALAERSPPVPVGSGAELLSIPGIGLPPGRHLDQLFWA